MHTHKNTSARAQKHKRTQAVLVFTALKQVQKRLCDEGSGLLLAVSVFRNTLVPRVDGRNGFIFKLSLLPSSSSPGRQVVRGIAGLAGPAFLAVWSKCLCVHHVYGRFQWGVRRLGRATCGSGQPLVFCVWWAPSCCHAGTTSAGTTTG